MTAQFPLTDFAPLAPAADDAERVDSPLWRTVIPWDDLTAKNIPSRYLNLGTDIQIQLALLAAARGASGPRLLSTDALGRLSTLANPAAVDLVRQDLLQGQFALQVGDQTLFPVGSIIMVASPSGPFRHRVLSWQPNNVLNLFPNAYETYQTGIQVIGESVVSTDPRFRITDTETWQTSQIPAAQYVDAGLTGVLSVTGTSVLGVQVHFTCAQTTAFELVIGNANAAIFKRLWMGQLFGGVDRGAEMMFPYPLRLDSFLALTDTVHVFVKVDTAGPDCRGTLFVDNVYRG